jgi:hypothetical protein
MAVRFRLVGLPRFLATLGAAKRDLQNQSETMLEAAELLGRTISTTAPRRTGRLASSPEPDSDQSGGDVLLPLEYSSYVNYGVPSRHMLASRFVERARDIAQAAIGRRISAGLQRALDRVKGA